MRQSFQKIVTDYDMVTSLGRCSDIFYFTKYFKGGVKTICWGKRIPRGVAVSSQVSKGGLKFFTCFHGGGGGLTFFQKFFKLFLFIFN